MSPMCLEIVDRFRYLKIAKPFHTARRGAKLAHFRIHDLRHGFASRLAEAGLSDQQLAGLLGHGSSQMVSRYSHLRPESLGMAADVLDRLSGAELLDLSVPIRKREKG